jgi:hypothetical protein
MVRRTLGGSVPDLLSVWLLPGYVTFFMIPETEKINGPKIELPFNGLSSSERE